MRTHRPAALILTLAAACHAQTVGPERVVAQGGNSLSHQECVVAVNPFDSHEAVVAWQTIDRSGLTPTRIHYATTFDGATFPTTAMLPLAPGPVPATVTFDPVIAASHQTGDIWVGGAENNDQRIFVGRKDAGASTIQATDVFAVTPTQSGFARDKPWLAIGPRPDGTAETMYASFAIPFAITLWTARCSDAAPLGTAWNAPVQVMAPGPIGPIATATAVVRHGIRSGRLVLTQSDNESHPQWMQTDDGGITWSNALPIVEHSTGQIRDLVGVGSNIVPYGMRARTFPSMAVDPNDSSIVYIIFSARDAGAGNASNVDLFVAYSENGGETFPPQQVFRLTDRQLAIEGSPDVEADQLIPAIAIDGEGGINILFIHTTSPDGPNTPTPPAQRTLANVYYARFTDRTQLAATPFIDDLTPGGFEVSPIVNGSGLSIGFNLNEYMMLDAVGCTVYAVYCRTEIPPVTGDRLGTVCFRRISVTDGCMADSDGDGAITANDPPAFMNAYAAGAPRADMNLDGTVNAQDGVAFLSAYAAASGTP
ncbi:MAG: GC-type dockerin domain-anchored protein [Phycisphaerales bacterium]